jgi:hypothetical protein
MSHALEENPLARLPHLLWSTARAREGTGVRLPRTIVFEYNAPKALYFSPAAGQDVADVALSSDLTDDGRADVCRVAGKDIDSRSVVELVCGPAPDARKPSKKAQALANAGVSSSVTTELKALYISFAPPHASLSPSGSFIVNASPVQSALAGSSKAAGYGGHGTSPPSGARTEVGGQFVTQYFTRASLHYFVQGASVLSASTSASMLGTTYATAWSGNAEDFSALGPEVINKITNEVALISSKDGVLQQLPSSGCSYHEVIEVVWSRHVVVCEKLRNRHTLDDDTVTCYDRAATFDGPPNVATRKFVAPAVQDQINAQLRDILRRVTIFVPGQRITEATFYFKVDRSGLAWLLFSTRIRLGAVPSPDVAPAARASRIARAIARHTACDTGGLIQAGPRPLSLVEFTEADAERDFMLRRMMTASEALGGKMRPVTTVAKYRRSQSTDGSSAPFYVPPASKNTLLLGVTRSASRNAARTEWNHLAHTQLAAASGIANARSRAELDAVSLEQECFRPKPIELKCLDRQRTVGAPPSATRSRLAPKLSWIQDPSRDLTTHRYSSFLSRKNTAVTMISGRSSPRATPSASVSPRHGMDNLSVAESSTTAQQRSSFGVTPSDRSPNFRVLATPKKEPAVTLQELLDAAPDELSLLCRSVENAVAWVSQLRATSIAHFRTHPRAPLAVSLPPVLFPDPSVSARLAAFLVDDCGLERCTLQKALLADITVRREGVIDELSYHHNLTVAGVESQTDAIVCLIAGSLRSISAASREEVELQVLTPLLLEALQSVS